MFKKYLLNAVIGILCIPSYAQPIDAGETLINLMAVSGMQFDLVRFTVKPGVKVKINFTNSDDMNHNFLITKPGTRLDVVNQALNLEDKGPLMNYIPESDKVLWSIPVISVNQTASITFTSPSKPGAFPYVCTYPGHGFTMYGVMYVSNDDAMPALNTDENIPPSRREIKNDKPAQQTANVITGNATHVNHPYDAVPPYLYRIFMDDSGPASIAVSLTNDLSYCWDTGTCKLRYAWAGGFVDNTAIWKGHIDANAKIIGNIFYRETSEYPVVIGKVDSKPSAEFKGYRLVDKYPEFHYQLNGIDVYELIKPKEDGNGIIRNFRIPKAGNTVWFTTNTPNSSVDYKSTDGTWVDGKLKLSPEEAIQFSVTMTNYSLLFNTRRKRK